MAAPSLPVAALPGGGDCVQLPGIIPQVQQPTARDVQVRRPFFSLVEWNIGIRIGNGGPARGFVSTHLHYSAVPPPLLLLPTVTAAEAPRRAGTAGRALASLRPPPWRCGAMRRPVGPSWWGAAGHRAELAAGGHGGAPSPPRCAQADYRREIACQRYGWCYAGGVVWRCFPPGYAVGTADWSLHPRHQKKLTLSG